MALWLCSRSFDEGQNKRIDKNILDIITEADQHSKYIHFLAIRKVHLIIKEAVCKRNHSEKVVGKGR